MIMINELKKLIKENGYTIKEFAQLLGSSSKTLNIKFNKGILGSDDIEKIIIILEIKNPTEIFFNKGVT